MVDDLGGKRYISKNLENIFKTFAFLSYDFKDKDDPYHAIGHLLNFEKFGEGKDLLFWGKY